MESTTVTRPPIHARHSNLSFNLDKSSRVVFLIHRDRQEGQICHSKMVEGKYVGR